MEYCDRENKLDIETKKESGIWICYWPKIMQLNWMKIVVLEFQPSKPKLRNSNGKTLLETDLIMN
jgi:hypothetical protein